MGRCRLLIQRTKTSWYSTSLRRAAELKIPHILSSACWAVNENVRLFDGVDDENLWGHQQVPASWLNLHVLMMSAKVLHGPWSLTKTLHRYNQPACDTLQCSAGIQPLNYIYCLMLIVHSNCEPSHSCSEWFILTDWVVLEAGVSCLWWSASSALRRCIFFYWLDLIMLQSFSVKLFLKLDSKIIKISFTYYHLIKLVFGCVSLPSY